MPDIPDAHQVLVLYGDVPLLLADNAARSCIARRGARSVALLTAQLADPSGYGRVRARRRAVQLRRIVEERDASARQRAIREVNTGVLVRQRALLKNWLARLKPRNAQREYYLTDIVAHGGEAEAARSPPCKQPTRRKCRA